MKIRMLGTGTGGASDLQYMSSYVVNDTLAIDAGTLGLHGTPGQQAMIRRVFLTHTHIDHIAALATFIENTFEPGREPVAIYGHSNTLADLRNHLFNDVVWADLIRLSGPGLQFLKMCPLEP